VSQSTRTLLTLVVLLAAGVGVGLYAWKAVYEGDEKEEKKKDVDEHLFPLAEKGSDGGTPSVEFVKLKITSGTETTTLENDKSGWKVVSPVQAAADHITVEGITSALKTSKFKYVADEAPDDAALEKYGLKKPTFVIEAEALVGEAKERRSVKLVAGAENTFNGSIFMLRNDEKKVWGAEGGVKWSFQRTTLELRDKELVALDEPKVSAIDVKTKNHQYSLTRDADKNWVLRPAQPKKGEESFLADASAINGAIAGLKGERAAAFPEPETKTGLDAPFEDLTFTTETGTVRVKLSKVGGSDGGPEKIYEQRDDARGTVVGEVNANVLSHFDRNPYDLRDKSVLVFKKEAVAKVTFHPREGPDIVVEKDPPQPGAAAGETWRVTAPKAGAAKQFKIAAILWALGSIKGDTVDEHPKDLKKYGLDKPVTVSVATAEGKELGRLSVGADVADKPGQKYLKGTHEAVVGADATRLADLPANVDDVLEPPHMLVPDAGH
jgi:hypothetical protein